MPLRPQAQGHALRFLTVLLLYRFLYRYIFYIFCIYCCIPDKSLLPGRLQPFPDGCPGPLSFTAALQMLPPGAPYRDFLPFKAVQTALPRSL
jgi:hypothetical protein